MSFRKFNFALVTHALEIAKAVDMCADAGLEKITRYLVNLDNAVPVAQAALDGGADVVIGHGGTGALLLQSLGMAVVNIPRTYLDLIRTIQKAKGFSRQMAITAFGEPVDGLTSLGSILGVEITPIVFHTTSELADRLSAAIEAGIPTILGGGVSQKMAEFMGTRCIIIEPSLPSIQKALATARAMAAARRKEQESREQMKIILENVDDGIIGVDRVGALNFYNRAAEDILGIRLSGSAAPVFARYAKALSLSEAQSTGVEKEDLMPGPDRNPILFKTLPIRMHAEPAGAVAFFRATASIHKKDRQVREKLYQKGFVARYTLDDLTGGSAALQRLKDKARRYAAHDAAVLIHGETGTGKEILAHALHRMSPRQARPFVAVNCAALPESLLESELFGYEEGAFTGAKKGGKIGLFELADHGTLFLDEVADISRELQVRLLRVLETNEVMRVGGDRLVPVNVRIIAAAQKDLRAEMQHGGFRSDLYFRLATLRLQIPPLRERPNDLDLYVQGLLKKHGKPASAVTRAMRNQLRQYDWPGNYREVNALVESYLILLGGENHDAALFAELWSEFQFRAVHPPPTEDLGEPLKERVDLFKRQVMEETLRACRYNRQAAAQRLGISVNTLWRTLKQGEKPEQP